MSWYKYRTRTDWVNQIGDRCRAATTGAECLGPMDRHASCRETTAAAAAVGFTVMAQTVIVKLTDDIDGGDAEETVVFGIDGKTFEIDLNKKNAAALRKAIAPYVDKARAAGRPSQTRGQGRTGQSRRGGRTGVPTLFSQLDAEEKDRFRAWADMPTARRIGDARVTEWIDAGRP